MLTFAQVTRDEYGHHATAFIVNGPAVQTQHLAERTSYDAATSALEAAGYAFLSFYASDSGKPFWMFRKA